MITVFDNGSSLDNTTVSSIINMEDYRKTSARKFNRPVPVTISKEEFATPIKKKRKQAADPIKSVEEINKIINYFLSKGQFRNNLLFVMGINFGLRCGDLLKLKIGHIVDENACFRSKVVIQEEKTDKERVCYMNDSIMDAAELYLCSLTKDGEELCLNDFLFKNLSNNNTPAFYAEHTNKKPGASITVRSVERMLKKTINEKLNININAGTHCMRKTFAYHVIMSAPDRSRAIEFLQKIFGHASQSITLAYAGITDEEIMDTCRNLNLGEINMDFCYSSGLSVAI